MENSNNRTNQIFINKKLGSGRRSIVYEGIYYDKEQQKNIKCAVKVIKLLDGNRFEQNLIDKEVNILNILKDNKHPNIVDIYHTNFTDTECHIYMEYMDYSLGDISGKPIKEDIVKYITKNILSGIKHLRKLGIFHRDIKPDNILVSEMLDKIKITDFSLSEYGESEFYIKCGSPMYMSPEISKGLKYDDTSDIYSLGVTIFYLLYGFGPYDDCFSESEDLFFDKDINKITPECELTIREMLKKDNRIKWEKLEKLSWLTN